MTEIWTPEEFAKKLFAKRDDWELVVAMIAARDSLVRGYVLNQLRDLSDKMRHRNDYIDHVGSGH